MFYTPLVPPKKERGIQNPPDLNITTLLLIDPKKYHHRRRHHRRPQVRILP